MNYYQKYILYKKKYIKLKNSINNQKGGNKIFPNSVPFEPETEPEYLDYDKGLFNKIFPKTKNMKKLKLSNIGKYSVSNYKDADKLSKIIKEYFPKNKKITITDANGNMGGNTISFSKFFDKVNSVEVLPFHCEILKNNLEQYKFTKNVKLLCSNYLDKIESLKQDVIFFDPPWGGTSYKKKDKIDLFLNQVHMGDIIKYLINKTELIAMKVPRNFNFSNLFNRIPNQRIDIYKVLNKYKKISYYYLLIKSS